MRLAAFSQYHGEMIAKAQERRRRIAFGCRALEHAGAMSLMGRHHR
jgi:hypothetical protein